jgi:hypothetical protein
MAATARSDTGSADISTLKIANFNGIEPAEQATA